MFSFFNKKEEEIISNDKDIATNNLDSDKQYRIIKDDEILSEFRVLCHFYETSKRNPSNYLDSFKYRTYKISIFFGDDCYPSMDDVLVALYSNNHFYESNDKSLGWLLDEVGATSHKYRDTQWKLSSYKDKDNITHMSVNYKVDIDSSFYSKEGMKGSILLLNDKNKLVSATDMYASDWYVYSHSLSTDTIDNLLEKYKKDGIESEIVINCDEENNNIKWYDPGDTPWINK